MENKGFEFYKKIGEPKHVLAPMVEQSELPYRMLTRRYGAHLAYTPMLHARLMVEDKGYKKANFSTCAEDRPLIVQFCGNDPDYLLRAAKLVEDECDAVDINLGCPQGIARRGQYGSFLLSKPDLICAMVENLAKNLKIPVTCKIRILPKEEDTFALVKRIVDAGCSLLTVHGRTKEQNKHLVGTCDWDIIKKIKQMVNIPVFANGGIYCYEDVQRCLEYTGVDGVMSAESILENPALFSGKVHDLDDLAIEYLDIVTEHPTDMSYVRPHLFKIMYTGLQKHTDLRELLSRETTMEGFYNIARELKKRREQEAVDSKLGWYIRHWIKEAEAKAQSEIEAQKEPVPEVIEDFDLGLFGEA